MSELQKPATIVILEITNQYGVEVYPCDDIKTAIERLFQYCYDCWRDDLGTAPPPKNLPHKEKHEACRRFFSELSKAKPLRPESYTIREREILTLDFFKPKPSVKSKKAKGSQFKKGTVAGENGEGEEGTLAGSDEF